MATRKRVVPNQALTLEGLIEKYGIAALGALRNPALWDVIVPMGPGKNGVLSAAAKKQLQGELNAVYGVLLNNAKAGDAISGAFAAQVAMSKAVIH
ncbi:hypothetical protein SAMN05216570_0567 [Dyella sp. OK004]|uniref:Uncharacterized protein n=1 Tax=Dyella koreensis TaxID=311235 RepID=A0ABW8K5N0_9GAMM|nr:hypothetical protein [Dyella sp. OK004]SFR91336.1 hypothetical protein SAMN05216570_0567 [Dyella sp. OK004]